MPAESFLILGANSFYGYNFARHVRERGDTPHCLHRPSWSLADGLPDGEWNYIVNFASQSLVAESWDNPTLWLATNTVQTTRLFEQLVDRKGYFKKFIHVSTPESYGDTPGWVNEEYREWRPSTPYAVSRAAADHMLMAYHHAHGLPAIITRTANIYGAGQGQNRFIPMAIDHLRRGERILLHGSGHTMRCFTHVQDACSATYKIAKEGTTGLTYHISSTRNITINALARMLCRMAGKRPEEALGTQVDRLGKDHAYLLDSTRIRNMGWRDEIQLEKGLQELWERN